MVEKQLKRLLKMPRTRAKLVTMQEGKQIDVESDPRGGIYVVISGLIKTDRFIDIYTSNQDVDSDQNMSLFEYSNILNFVTLSSLPKTTEKTSDFISTGAVVGELSLLTGKPWKTIITCDTSVQMYHIDYETIQAALELFTDSPSLEYRLWRVAAVRVALPIIKQNSYYRGWDIDRIGMLLEKCALIMKKWHLSHGIDSLQPYALDIESLPLVTVILIFGFAQDPHTRTLYQGPCHVPRNVKILNLLPCKTDKHVLLVISHDVNSQVEVSEILDEEDDYLDKLRVAIQKATQSGAVKRESSTLCLLHSARERKDISAKCSENKLNLESKIMKKVSSLMVGNTGRESSRISDKP
ncbi:hypothetical protein LSH36_878g01034, partial [Paralvinella palmiformis]